MLLSKGSGLRHRHWFAGKSAFPHPCKAIEGDAGGGYQHGESERGHVGRGFIACKVESDSDKEGGADAEDDGNPVGAGNTEGPHEGGLTATQEDECKEIEHDGHAPEQQVDGDEALESEPQRKRPAGGRPEWR